MELGFFGIQFVCCFFESSRRSRRIAGNLKGSFEPDGQGIALRPAGKRQRLLKWINGSLRSPLRRTGEGLASASRDRPPMESNRWRPTDVSRQSSIDKPKSEDSPRFFREPRAVHQLGATLALASLKREIRIAAAFMQFREVKLNNLSRPTDVRRREGW